MQDDCIAVALELPQLKILRQKEMENHFEVTVIYRRGEVICPWCGRATAKEHDRRQQCKQDRRLRDKTVLLTLIKRRFRCLFVTRCSQSQMMSLAPGDDPVIDSGSI